MRKLIASILVLFLLTAQTGFAQVSDTIFKAMIDRQVELKLADGETVAGTLAGQSEKKVVVLLPDGTPREIDKSKVDSLKAKVPKSDSSEVDKKATAESESMKLSHVCHYGHVYDKSHDAPELKTGAESARRIVAKIARHVGMSQPPQVHAGNVPNALAAVYMGKRVILYNPQFMADISQKGGTLWVAYSILAHELGHHINGHTATREANSWMREFQADYYSGFALAKLGASLSQAKSAMRAMQKSYGNLGSSSHPPIDKRLEEIERGWKEAKALSGGPDTEENSQNETERQRKLQAERERQRKLQAERERQRELRAERERQRKLQAERERQRKLQAEIRRRQARAQCMQQCQAHAQQCAGQVQQLAQACRSGAYAVQVCRRKVHPMCGQRVPMPPHVARACSTCMQQASRQCTMQVRRGQYTCGQQAASCQRSCQAM